MNATPASTIEVYRLTPRNIISLTNKDTGDITGDVFFNINEYGPLFEWILLRTCVWLLPRCE